MARPSATTLLLLLVSLLAIAHCRTLESDPATGTSTAETATVEGATEVVPVGILRLPSHRRHHPCHHGVFGDGHRFHRRGDAELVRDAAEADEEELKPVAEPDPDHSVTNVDDGGDGDDAAVKRWRKEMLWRMFRHGLRHHHHEGDEEEEDHDQEEEKGRPVGMKRFRHHHHHEDDEEEEEEEEMRKLFHPHADDGESDEELEEVVRRFRKAVMRRRFHLHGRFFRHHQHHHAEEQAEGGGVVTWIKGLMNRF